MKTIWAQILGFFCGAKIRDNGDTCANGFFRLIFHFLKVVFWDLYHSEKCVFWG